MSNKSLKQLERVRKIDLQSQELNNFLQNNSLDELDNYGGSYTYFNFNLSI